MISPVLAGDEVYPGNAPAGPTYVPSAWKAPTYWLPPTSNGGLCLGAHNPGCTVFTVTVTGALVPAAVETVSCSGPVPVLAGTWASTCPGLMYWTKADCPAMVTAVRSSEVGAFTPLGPLKSDAAQGRESAAGLE